jgi:hypothetical protein
LCRINQALSALTRASDCHTHGRRENGRAGTTNVCLTAVFAHLSNCNTITSVEEGYGYGNPAILKLRVGGIAAISLRDMECEGSKLWGLHPGRFYFPVSSPLAQLVFVCRSAFLGVVCRNDRFMSGNNGKGGTSLRCSGARTEPPCHSRSHPVSTVTEG